VAERRWGIDEEMISAPPAEAAATDARAFRRRRPMSSTSAEAEETAESEAGEETRSPRR